MEGGRGKVSCRCECGVERRVSIYGLRIGDSKSCGCLHREIVGAMRKTHGYSGMREYRIWFAMLKRCYNPKHIYYSNYGGRGISVCERWRESFDAFFECMGNSPKGTTLDRIDNDGNYEPGNCRWATDDQQKNNRRANHLLTAFGKTQTMVRWAREYGIRFGTLRERIVRGYMSVEDAISKPVQIQVHKKRS